MSDSRNPKRAVATAIRAVIVQQNYDRDRLAAKVHLSRSAIDKMLTGLFSDRALAQVEKNTGVRFGPQTVVTERASRAWWLRAGGG